MPALQLPGSFRTSGKFFRRAPASLSAFLIDDCHIGDDSASNTAASPKRETLRRRKSPNAQFPIPNAQCLMPNT